jgi:hypothetical protein
MTLFNGDLVTWPKLTLALKCVFFFFFKCLAESATSWARARVTRGRVIQLLPL